MSRRPQRSNGLPSTPGRQSLQSQPSTTPLMPPPSYLMDTSTTPAGPPPRSAFGSSFNPTSQTFPKSHASGLRSFTLPDSSPPRSEHNDLPEPDTQLDGMGIDDSAMILHGHNSTLMSSLGAGARGLKRSRDGRAKEQAEYRSIARSFVAQKRQQELPESDDIVLQVDKALHGVDPSSESIEALQSTARNLTSSWRKLYAIETKEGGIGPATEDSIAIATYVASFALQTHFPGDATQRDGLSGGTTVPKALLDWLNTYHNPFPDDFTSILSTQPAPSAHESFWDVVYSSTLRGRIDRTIRLLQNAGWEHAVTALDDEATSPGYSGYQLQNTRRCAQQCVDTLSSCPLSINDWDVKGSEWSLFRRRVRIVYDELQALAGEAADDGEDDNIFTRSMQGSFNYSKASRKAESKVPWSIFENLKLLYSQLLGQVDDVLMTSQDWLEASIFLTVWWDGNDGDGFTPSKSAMRREAERTREVDITPLHAYRNRLGDAFTLAVSETSDTGFSLDSTDPAQVGLACVLEDDTTGVLLILQSLSLPVAAVMAEIAALDGWETDALPRQLTQQGFDADDLLVLDQSQRSNQHDEILLQYGALLTTRESFKTHTEEREGWELASSVYGHLFDAALADEKIAHLLDRVELDTIGRADKVLQLCSALGLTEQARQVAERFADSLTEAGKDYGAILIFYARAHAFDKLDSTLALLTSYCLVQSLAIPPRGKLDEYMDSLLGDRIELLALSQADSEAATYLASQLSGYATVRRFYELRDGRKGRKEAAEALLSLIASSSDCIRGGLFDPSIQSVLPVDGILVLLGELLPFCQQELRVLTSQDIFTVLRVIEDFSASPTRIHEAAEDVLRACKKACSGPVPSLQKSRSDISTNSGLSGSSYELLMASSTMLSRSSGSNAVERTWDWRKGLAGVVDLSASTLLLLLRTALAQELGKVWIDACV